MLIEKVFETEQEPYRIVSDSFAIFKNVGDSKEIIHCGDTDKCIFSYLLCIHVHDVWLPVCVKYRWSSCDVVFLFIEFRFGQLWTSKPT